VPASELTDAGKDRPATFNRPWTSEEQRLLEELLHKYPPERFEARRFSKIAAELPGRTTQQVTSRVQKYFIKLAKAGLPVPGRMPNLAAYGGRWFSGRYHGHHQRHHHFYFPSSTFLTSYAPPVYMSDVDDDDSEEMLPPAAATASAGSVSIDAVDIPSGLSNMAEYRQLKTLTAVRQARLLRSQNQAPVECPVTVQSSELASNDVVRTAASSHIDPDYISQSTGGVSSYLDPNYMPAV